MLNQICFKIFSITTKIKEIDNITLKILEGKNWNTENLKNTLAENYPEYMDRYSIMMERLKMAITWNASSI